MTCRQKHDTSFICLLCNCKVPPSPSLISCRALHATANLNDGAGAHCHCCCVLAASACLYSSAANATAVTACYSSQNQHHHCGRLIIALFLLNIKFSAAVAVIVPKLLPLLLLLPLLVLATPMLLLPLLLLVPLSSPIIG